MAGGAMGGQCEKVLVTKCKDLNSIPGTHMVVTTDSKLPLTSTRVLWYSPTHHTYTHIH